MKRTVVVFIVAALVLAVCAAAVWSQGGKQARPAGRPGGMGGAGMGCPAMAVMPPQPMMFERMAETLELTDEQLTQLKDAADKNQVVVQPLMQKAGDACKAVREAVMASEYDAAKVQGLAAAAQKAEAAVISANINGWTEIRSILTTDQVAKLKEIQSTQRMGPGGPGPMGPPPPAPEQ